MVVIGLENVLVLTKSVVSTPVDLEVKLRIAQGNFITESTITFLFSLLAFDFLENRTASGMSYCINWRIVFKCLFLFLPGLSNESWSIMKNMATELCIILIGYFTLVPAIQVTELSYLNGNMLMLYKNSWETMRIWNKRWCPCCFLSIVGVLSVRCCGAGVWLLPADVLLHNSAIYRHPTHGGDNSHTYTHLK